jgi:hypothetical protein
VLCAQRLANEGQGEQSCVRALIEQVLDLFAQLITATLELLLYMHCLVCFAFKELALFAQLLNLAALLLDLVVHAASGLRGPRWFGR